MDLCLGDLEQVVVEDDHVSELAVLDRAPSGGPRGSLDHRSVRERTRTSLTLTFLLWRKPDICTLGRQRAPMSMGLSIGSECGA